MRLPEEVEITLYRTAQEAIANALRHGEAQSIQVRLQNRPRAVWLDHEPRRKAGRQKVPG
jgi:signal transduction histidine kinase